MQICTEMASPVYETLSWDASSPSSELGHTGACSMHEGGVLDSLPIYQHHHLEYVHNKTQTKVNPTDINLLDQNLPQNEATHPLSTTTTHLNHQNPNASEQTASHQLPPQPLPSLQHLPPLLLLQLPSSAATTTAATAHRFRVEKIIVAI